jgi:lipopolysaccharide transport system ATP-binding protein
VAWHSAVPKNGKKIRRFALIDMSDIVIAVENLSKCYLIGHQFAQRERYTALRDVISREARNFARKAADFVHGRQIVQGDEIEQFWALRDVSFKVRRGEVLGIVGRNGAGKSTLLKVLSRITEPDGGRAVLSGRVSSLLEVGTGFHPELTGRQNIYLNGAILGMKEAEINRKFDEIVAFSEMERFLDMPVKQYSSGMYVRLAFAVAAHLEPEILIVDEVLAVGDINFQKKCVGKMQDVAANDGRTVLLVSHNMAVVESMCNSAILLTQGRCVAQGSTAVVIQEYFRDIERASVTPLHLRIDREGSGLIRFVSVELESSDGSVPAFRCGAEAIVHLVLENRTKRELGGLEISLHFVNDSGQVVAVLNNHLIGLEIPRITRGRTSIRAVIPKMPLIPGRYSLILWSMIEGNVADWIKNAAVLDVESGDYYGTGIIPERRNGMFLFDHRFVVSDDQPVELERLG